MKPRRPSRAPLRSGPLARRPGGTGAASRCTFGLTGRLTGRLTGGLTGLLAGIVLVAVSFLTSPPAGFPQQSQEAVPDQETISAPEAVEAREGPVYHLPIDGVIELGLAPFVERGLREAAQEGAAVVILEIATDGGRVDAAERIAQAVSDSEVPVYAYINRRALSAGALISLATDRIYMRPGSRIGAATPVVGTGEEASEKVVSAMRSTMRSLAEARDLDPAIAEAMVDARIEVPGVVEEGRLLTLTTEEAVEVGYARTANDWNDLMAQLGTTGNPRVDLEVNWAERVVRFLSHPIVAPFLLSIGFLGLLVEIKTPGLGIAGGAGVLALALFFGSHLIIGLAGAEGLIIFALGALLILVEAFVIPGFGVFGILGIIAVLSGVYMSLLGGLPTTEDYARAGTVLSGSVAMVVLGSWFLLRRLPANRRLTRLGIFLGEDTGRDVGYISAERRDELLGREGTALTDLRPSGTGVFDDERIDVVSEQEWIEAGSPIRIVASEGYRHVVRPVRIPGGGAQEPPEAIP